MLLDKVSNIDLKGACGNTALLYAAKAKSLHFVKMILEKNADVNMQNKNGLTALMIATEQAVSLHERGVRFQDDVSERKRRALIDIIKCLLEHGADKSLTANNGKCVDEIAAESPVIKELLDTYYHSPSYILK